jgi:amino acid adenylation domain-containing protein
MNMPSSHIQRMPMSSVQRRLYLQCQLPGGDIAYHLLYLARVRGGFSLSGAQDFAARMIERHASLRTAFRMENGEFIAEVHPQIDFSFTVIDGNEADLDEIVQTCDRPFDLTAAPLFRLHILRLSEAECILIFNCHHLIFDGYSAGILGKDILDELSGHKLDEPERTYFDFVQWEKQFFHSTEYKRQQIFWLEKHPDPPKRVALPTDFTPPATKSFAGDYFIRYLDTKDLKALCRAEGVTLFVTLLAAFYCVLSKLSKQQEITLGTLVSPRESGHFQTVMGLFANTLPLTQVLNPQTTFSELLQTVRTLVFQAMQHADFPFEHLVSQLPFLEKGVRNPLFDIVFNFERVARGKIEAFGDVTVEPLNYYAKVSMFDLAIDLVEYEDQVRFKLEYATTLYRNESMQGLMDAYFGIIQQVCRQPHMLIGDLSLVAEDTHDQLLQWNDTARSLKKGWTFLDIWKRQAVNYADNPALRLNGRELTYGQLEERANRLAHYLIDQKIGPESVVAVVMEPSPEWVIAILALWKIGAVYLPLAASHPRKRLMYQLADSKAALVLTHDHLQGNFSGFSPVLTTEALESILATSPQHAPQQQIQAGQPAYIIYTSGSTGTPKGVLVNHLSTYAHIDGLKGVYKLRSDDNVLQFSSPTFDASLEQILVTLAAGACLILLDSQLKAPRDLLDTLIAEEIHVAEFPPAYLRELLPALTPYALRTIRLLVSGGDVLTATLAREIMQYLPADAKFLNFYGPTEATMAATVYPVPGNLQPYDSWLSLPIGKPLPNTRITILDKNQQLLPIGMAGELCIAGERLAQGYLNREDLTTEQFVEMELMGSLERVYKTGDRARWLADGTIEFLGRLDRQVQLRGYRIELAEIEQTLQHHPDVRDVVVIKNSEHQESLTAIVATDQPSTMNAGVLYAWLKDYLPGYMIPATFSVMEAIPRTAEGKLDRPALTVESDSCPVAENDMPRDPLELDLWSMWRNILNLQHIGRNDNFFHIGGNSLSVIQVMVEVKNKYHLDLPLSLLLQTPTIAILADFLRSAPSLGTPACVVTLNREGNGPPIVLIPGQGGNILDLYELSACLNKEFPCYGLQHPWDSSESTHNDSIEELASYYVHELEASISLPGCILVGHSFGGYVAYEMARILQQRQRPAQSLLLLDVVAPKGAAGADNRSLTAHEVLDLTIKCLMGSRDNALGNELKRRKQGDNAEAKALAYLQKEGRLPDSLSIDRFRYCVQTIVQRGAAFANYQPASPIDTDIILYRAQETDKPQGVKQEGWDWAGFTSGSFVRLEVPGDHFTMIKGGNASALAEAIQNYLLRSDKG